MNIEEAGKMLQLISDPNRLVIVKLLLKNKKMSANEFLKSISCKQSTLSHHLNEMVDAELLNFKKRGNKVIYSLNTKKYAQLLNFLDIKEGPVEEVKEEQPKVEPVKEEKKEVYRVVDSDLVRPDPVKVELPFYLL